MQHSISWINTSQTTKNKPVTCTAVFMLHNCTEVCKKTVFTQNHYFNITSLKIVCYLL